MAPSILDRPRPKHLAPGSELPAWWSTIDRRRVAVALGISLLAVPVIALDNLPDRSSAEAVEVTTGDGSLTTTARPVVTPTTGRSTTTVPSTTAPPPTKAPPPTEAVAALQAPPTTVRPTTTTTAPPPPTTAPPTTAPPTTAPPPAPAPTGNRESGGATWYRHGAGECAHKTIALGTVVTVTNQANGASATCTVTDRGPYGTGRIIDLDVSVFEQLAPLRVGVIRVTITW